MDNKADYRTFPGIGLDPIVDLPKYITMQVGKFYGLTEDELRGGSRKRQKREIVEPRQVAMSLMYAHTKLTSQVIGAYFGKDHATVLHAKKVVSNLQDSDRKFSEVFAAVEYNVTRAISDSFHTMVDRASVLFDMPMIQIVGPKRITQKTYRVRTAIISAHQYRYRTSKARLAELLGVGEPDIKRALNECVKYQAMDVKFYNKVLKLKGV